MKQVCSYLHFTYKEPRPLARVGPGWTLKQVCVLPAHIPDTELRNEKWLAEPWTHCSGWCSLSWQSPSFLLPSLLFFHAFLPILNLKCPDSENTEVRARDMQKGQKD